MDLIPHPATAVDVDHKAIPALEALMDARGPPPTGRNPAAGSCGPRPA